jgi:hypothetical protein
MDNILMLSEHQMATINEVYLTPYHRIPIHGSKNGTEWKI